MTPESRGSANGEMTRRREKRMTLMAFGLGASSFYGKHELNIAQGQSSSTGHGVSH